MASQTGSIDLTASNSVKLAAEAGWQSDLDSYYTKSEIDVTVGGINSTVSTKVGENEVISSINQSAESVTINASKINLTGAVTISDLASDASTALTDAAQTATNYIRADSTGVRIANANPSTATTYQHLTATNTEFVAGGNTVASFGSTVTLGGTSESHVVVSQDAITMLDAKGNVFMDVRDNGLYQTRTYTLTASGYHSAVFPDPQPMLIKDSETDVTITVDGVPYEYGVDVTFDKHSSGDVVTLYDVWFRDPVPAAGSSIVVTFRTESDKTYTLGKRTDGTTEGPYSVVEGYNNEASGYMSHAEGGECSSTNSYAHSEGGGCTASHLYAHAEGCNTTASERAAHSEGWGTIASGAQSHAEGFNSEARAGYAHAQNLGTIAASEAQTALGRYNVADANNTYAVIVGNGTSNSSRSNVLTVDWGGNVTHGVDVPWTNLQLASSVEPYSDGQTPRYRKWGPVVQVLGAVKLKSNQSAGFNVNIGTLPSGCRPLTQVATVCQGSGNDTWLCNVSAGGVMNIERYRNGGTSAAATTSTWLPFSITFLTA